MQMLNQTNRIMFSALGVLMLCGVANLAASDGGKAGSTETRLHTGLSGASIQGRTPSGHADFRVEARGRSRFNVEVEDVNLAQGTVLTVSIQSGSTTTQVGTIKLSQFGGGELELNSQDGDMVQAAKAMDIVIVSNGATPILAGVF
jgi:hypothetical protein